jgi:hypothetical protein
LKIVCFWHFFGFIFKTLKYINPENFIPIGRGQRILICSADSYKNTILCNVRQVTLPTYANNHIVQLALSPVSWYPNRKKIIEEKKENKAKIQ